MYEFFILKGHRLDYLMSLQGLEKETFKAIFLRYLDNTNKSYSGGQNE
ncbi:MAG: hypothetical protein MJH09_06480 [Cetobacterium sp.]|nr:hypothetical protein [Cetobacterium sp.]